MTAPPPIDVAAAVIRRADGHVLLAKRSPAAHQGGLWEFPGGKVEPGESTVDALARELEEELGIVIEAATPLIRIRHDYPDKRVDIATLEVHDWRGEPHGREGQPLRWVSPAALSAYRFPAANLPILGAALLPRLAFAERSDAATGVDEDALEDAVQAGARLVSLCGAGRSAAALAALVRRCQRRGVRVMIEGSPAAAAAAGADGVHLARCADAAPPPRAARGGLLLSMDVHEPADVERAAGYAADFVYTDPGLTPPAVATLAAAARLPLYAPARALDMVAACRAGCQGVVVSPADGDVAARVRTALAALTGGALALRVASARR